MKIFNSLTKKKQIFQPLEPGKVKMYVCGMTVYDYSHIGHARSLVTFDMVNRYFRARGFEVTFVRNITDIDDKIIQRARENQQPFEELTQRFIDFLHQDEKALNLLPPDYEPRATAYIAEIIAFITVLLEKKVAYIGENGDVYFSVRQYKPYGKLSNRNVDQLRSGARIGISDSKKDPLDFVLWKLAKPDEPQWDSPWGKGRPGWHIECSVMSTEILGQPFDIHGGGLDLKFPHHENEIAQSEAKCQKAFANIWMHTGLLQINKEKMSKSLGNFITIKAALEKDDAEVVRYFLLSGHYRSPLNYSQHTLENARAALSRLYGALRDLPAMPVQASDFTRDFYAAMDDDFNTPLAFAILFDMAREINRSRAEQQLQSAALLAAELQQLAGVFGLLQRQPEAFLHGNSADSQHIEGLIEARNKARQQRDWIAADRIRQQLLDIGVAIEDSPQGTIWRLL